MTVTSCPRSVSARALWSTCSVTPPTAGWNAWLTMAILSGIREHGSEDAPLIEVLADRPLLHVRDAAREPLEIRAEGKGGIGALDSVEAYEVTAAHPLRVRVHQRRPAPSGEER